MGHRMNLSPSELHPESNVEIAIGGILEFGGSLEEKLEGYLPFTPLSLLNFSLQKNCRTILDVGCGKGNPMKFINRNRRFFTVGVDIFSPYLKECKRMHTHDDFVQCDIRALPFQARSFDVAIGLRVCEHLTMSEIIKLLRSMEKIARKQVAIITPDGSFEQSPFDDNPYQQHKSFLNVSQLKKLGYKVQVNGLRGVQGDTSKIGQLRRCLSLIGHILWVLSGPIVFLLPSLGVDLISTKSLCEPKTKNLNNKDFSLL